MDKTAGQQTDLALARIKGRYGLSKDSEVAELIGVGASNFSNKKCRIQYIGGSDVVSLFVKNIVEMNDQFYLDGDFICPGKLR